jgi:recombination protein RecR
MEFSSKLIENAVAEVSKLPGIGKKSALRVILHLLKQNVQDTVSLASAIVTLRNEIKYCQKCQNISDNDLCGICTSPKREQNIICVVETFKDIMSIENTGQYKGLYHVLGGLISPVEGVAPSDLNIQNLIERVQAEQTKELIFALSATMDGETTIFYITKKIKEFKIKTTTLARGIPFGSELEYTDELTLARSIQTRIIYE